MGAQILAHAYRSPTRFNVVTGANGSFIGYQDPTFGGPTGSKSGGTAKNRINGTLAGTLLAATADNVAGNHFVITFGGTGVPPVGSIQHVLVRDDAGNYTRLEGPAASFASGASNSTWTWTTASQLWLFANVGVGSREVLLF